MRFGTTYGAYSLTDLPGCPQVGVSHGSFIYEKMRGNGAGDKEHKQRLGYAARLGYDVLIATVRDDNPAQKRIMVKNGWVAAHSFTSSNSGGAITIYIKQLTRITPATEV